MREFNASAASNNRYCVCEVDPRLGSRHYCRFEKAREQITRFLLEVALERMLKGQVEINTRVSQIPTKKDWNADSRHDLQAPDVNGKPDSGTNNRLGRFPDRAGVEAFDGMICGILKHDVKRFGRQPDNAPSRIEGYQSMPRSLS